MGQPILSHQRSLLIKHIQDLLANSEPHSVAFTFHILGDEYAQDFSHNKLLSSLSGDVVYEGYPQVASLGYALRTDDSSAGANATAFLTGLNRLINRSEAGLRSLAGDDVAIIGIANGLTLIKQIHPEEIDTAQKWLIHIIDTQAKAKLWSYRMRDLAGDLLDGRGRLRTNVGIEDFSAHALELVLRNRWPEVYKQVPPPESQYYEKLLKSLLTISLDESVELEKAAVWLKALDLSKDHLIGAVLPRYDKSALTALEKIKNRIDEKASRRAKRRLWFSFGLLLLVYAALALLTYRLGWGIMEVWTYFIGAFALLCSYGYFVITLREFTPANIYEQFKRKQREKLYDEFNFDLPAYEDLAELATGAHHNLTKSELPRITTNDVSPDERVSYKQP